MNETGHMLVARIAWDKMTPAARAGLKSLTSDPNNPVIGKPTSAMDNDVYTAATWMDDIRPTDGNLHFVNTPVSGDGTMPPGDNGVTFIEQNIGILKDASASKDQKAEALRITMHLVGDLHQPLHCADNNDRGGNQFPLNWTKGARPGNLHGFWDAGGGVWNTIPRPLTAAGQAQLTKMASSLENQYPSAKYTVQAGDLNPEDWAKEGYAMAKKDCYTGVTAGAAPTAAYKQKAVKDMGYEATIGGYRLANLLNDIFSAA